MDLDEINNFIQNKRVLQKNICDKIFNSNKILKKFIEEGLTYQDIKRCLLYNEEIKHRFCEICGKEIHCIKLKTGFRKTCSIKCGAILASKTKEENNLKKFGVKHYFQSEEFKNKCKQTNKENYGVENVFASKEIKEKIKQTNLERYGVEFSSQTKESREKAKQTCLEHFGTEVPIQCDKIKKKIELTNLEKYGNVSPLGNLDIQEKAKETIKTKFGVDNPHQCEEIKNKIHKTKLDRSYEKLFSYPLIEPVFSRDKWFGHHSPQDGIVYEWKCKECGNVFKSPINGMYSIPICRKCHPYSVSQGQSELQEFIKAFYKSDFLINDRKIIKPLELDIVIPELNIAFEFNGTYTHSIANGKDSSYHLNKTIECEKLGIRLFHVWEHEWFNNEKIKEQIRHILFGNFQIKEKEIILNRAFPIYTKEQLKDFELVEVIAPK